MRTFRPAWAEIDLGAIRGNAGVLAELAPLCAVVKANGYGHGAVEVAGAALDGGATWLAVALVEEGVELRESGIAAPVLVLSEPPSDAMAAAFDQQLTPTIYSDAGVKAAAHAAGTGPWPVHVKVDTGMHRVGASTDDVLAIIDAVRAAGGLELGGVWTHLAVADEPDKDAFTDMQVERFDQALDRLHRAGIEPPMVHVANSAGAIAHPLARRAMVRAGIALYGHNPSAAVTNLELRPALSLKARVAHVATLNAGERVSYGQRYETPTRTRIATVPLGYADGVPRRLFEVGVPVLVGGRRLPIAGVITMDQFMVDCGPASDVAVGDEVVLIGRQGDLEISAEEWADALGTISYEVLCGIGPRVPRVYVG